MTSLILSLSLLHHSATGFGVAYVSTDELPLVRVYWGGKLVQSQLYRNFADMMPFVDSRAEYYPVFKVGESPLWFADRFGQLRKVPIDFLPLGSPAYLVVGRHFLRFVRCEDSMPDLNLWAMRDYMKFKVYTVDYRYPFKVLANASETHGVPLFEIAPGQMLHLKGVRQGREGIQFHVVDKSAYRDGRWLVFAKSNAESEMLAHLYKDDITWSVERKDLYVGDSASIRLKVRLARQIGSARSFLEVNGRRFPLEYVKE